ncbi:hypothetical protein EON65_56885, partial [archaeon]
MPPEQQIIKYRDEELKIDLTLKLEEHYGINSGERLYVYNRGGFMIHVHSPIKPQLDQLRDLESQKQDDGEAEVTLESAVVAAACTEPEKELFSHACHELKRYIHEGKGAIKELEAETFQDTPRLIQAYM